MDAKQRFKIAVLEALVAEGLTVDRMIERVKEASDRVASLPLTKQADGALSTVMAPVQKLWNAGIDTGAGLLREGGTKLMIGALAAPPLLGFGAGYGAARMQDVDDTDVHEIKNQELIDELNRQAVRLDRETAVRRFHKQNKRTGRMFV